MSEKPHGSDKRGEAAYGPRLSDDEYEQRIIELYETLPPSPSGREEERVRRMELDLKIDNRLGCDYPKGLREALWRIQCDVEKKRLRLIGTYLLKKLFSRSIAKDANNLANIMVDEYAQVLSKADLERFFDLKEGERAMLPTDIRARRRD